MTRPSRRSIVEIPPLSPSGRGKILEAWICKKCRRISFLYLTDMDALTQQTVIAPVDQCGHVRGHTDQPLRYRVTNVI